MGWPSQLKDKNIKFQTTNDLIIHHPNTFTSLPYIGYNRKAVN